MNEFLQVQGLPLCFDLSAMVCVIWLQSSTWSKEQSLKVRFKHVVYGLRSTNDDPVHLSDQRGQCPD